MNKILAALACCLFFSPTYASEPQAREIVRLMHFDRLAAYLVKTTLRERALKVASCGHAAT
jgi:hypothetical protein